MIPTAISLVLRTLKGSPLTWQEMDENLTHLKDAILGLSEELATGRVVLSETEPAAGERTQVVWIKPTTLDGVWVWDATNSRWKNVAKDQTLYAVATNAGDAYSATLPVTITALSDITGVPFVLKIPTGNTGASTLAINGLSATAIKKVSTAALEATDMVSGMLVVIVYDGTNFQLINPNPQARVIYNSVAICAYGGVTNTAPQSITTKNAEVTVQFNLPEVDPYGIVTLASNKFKFTNAGRYLFDVFVPVKADSSGAATGHIILKDVTNSAVLDSRGFYTAVSGNNEVEAYVPLTTIVNVPDAVTEYEVRIFLKTGSANVNLTLGTIAPINQTPYAERYQSIKFTRLS